MLVYTPKKGLVPFYYLVKKHTLELLKLYRSQHLITADLCTYSDIMFWFMYISGLQYKKICKYSPDFTLYKAKILLVRLLHNNSATIQLAKHFSGT